MKPEIVQPKIEPKPEKGLIQRFRSSKRVVTPLALFGIAFSAVGGAAAGCGEENSSTTTSERPTIASIVTTDTITTTESDTTTGTTKLGTTTEPETTVTIPTSTTEQPTTTTTERFNKIDSSIISENFSDLQGYVFKGEEITEPINVSSADQENFQKLHSDYRLLMASKTGKTFLTDMPFTNEYHNFSYNFDKLGGNSETEDGDFESESIIAQTIILIPDSKDFYVQGLVRAEGTGGVFIDSFVRIVGEDDKKDKIAQTFIVPFNLNSEFQNFSSPTLAIDNLDILSKLIKNEEILDIVFHKNMTLISNNPLKFHTEIPRDENGIPFAKIIAVPLFENLTK